MQYSNDPVQDFIDIIYDCVTKNYVENMAGRVYEGIHLSEILKCHRQYRIKQMGYRTVPDPESIMVLDNGSLTHGYFQNLLTKYGYVLPENIERKLKSTYYLLDSATDIALIKLAERWYLIDLKSIRCSKFKSDKGGFEGLEDAKDDHKKQVTLYAKFLLDELKSEGIEIDFAGVIVVYYKKCGGAWQKNFSPNPIDYETQLELQAKSEFNLVFQPMKRNGSIKGFFVPYDELEARILVNERVAKAQYYQDNNILPEPELDPYSDFYCLNFCGLQDICTSLS
ncbi:MAG: hypothetical protein Q8910_00500 [Bacteroidota bacterium]|nr:hypothetical protein [Bacteroidota bacterium]